jgi:hypothetical protein
MANIVRNGSEAQRWQESILLRFVRRAAETRFGREHGFSKIRSVADYRARVPLQDYGSMFPRFERARDGARDESWPGRPLAFAKTSGTTGAPSKYLPHTRESIRAQLRSSTAGMAAYLVRAGDRHLLRGRIAVLGGSPNLGRLPSGVAAGDATGILTRAAPRWTRWLRAPPTRVLEIRDWEERLAAAAVDLARREVRVLLGFPSWSLHLLDAVEREAGRPIRQVWPRWRGFVHTGMPFGPYRELYRRRTGHSVLFVDTFTSTEGGVMAVQDREGDPSLALICDRHAVFELIPVEETGAADPRRIGVHEAEPGRDYALAVTTNAGLWAYQIGDIVRPPRLLFRGRTKLFLNAFGEHLSQGELEEAVEGACRATGTPVTEFAVMPQLPGDGETRGRHLWIVECRGPGSDAEELLRRIDELLQRGNDDYRVLRAGDLPIGPPELRLLAPGTFYAWMRAQGRLGEQHNVPRVLDPDLARTLLDHGTPDPGDRSA